MVEKPYLMGRTEELILRNQVAIMTSLLLVLHKPGTPLTDDNKLLTEGINKTHIVLHEAKVFKS